MTRPALSVVIPTYNNADALEHLVIRLSTTLNATGKTYELIIVNDGSSDATWDTLKKISESTSALVAIDLLRNHGQARATMCGMAHARGLIVLTMDDDLQHPPEELPKLLDALEADPTTDAVMGWWTRDQGAFRNAGSRIHALIDRKANGTPKGFRHSSFRGMRRPVVDALVAHQTKTPVIGPLLRNVTDRITLVPVEHHPRAHGASQFRPAQGISTVLANLLQGSNAPLRGLVYFGGLCAASSAIAIIATLIGWANTPDSSPGWVLSFFAITFFGGTGLLGIGLLGEFVHLAMREVSVSPRWTIRQHVGGFSTVDSDDKDNY